MQISGGKLQCIPFEFPYSHLHHRFCQIRYFFERKSKTGSAILDLKGKPLIQRSYRDDVLPTYIERFLPIVLELEEEGQQVTPCFSREGVNYMHIRHSNLYRECPNGLKDGRY